MKVVSVVGARPQLIKAAVVSEAIRKHCSEVLVHTGQHYDYEMSDIFFADLELPSVDHHLGIGSGSHGWQTGSMLIALEEVLIMETPQWVLVYGDTNSTLAGALAASKMRIPLAHVEAGLRSYNRAMPEEINRIVADRFSKILFCPSHSSVRNLEKEGITNGVHMVGDVMYDAMLHYLPKAKDRPSPLERIEVAAGAYALATIHRAKNTDDPERLAAIMACLAVVETTVVFPAHPRTREALRTNQLAIPENVRLLEPVGYLDMLMLEQGASAILTDSGGVQKEAFWLQVPCVTLRDETEWVETVETGWNVVVGVDPERVQAAMNRGRPVESPPPVYGDGKAAGRIAELMAED
ncbi:MAG TPA: UDP-N-acetylglucosamine 2-epimerase (non-hydrolyzing) [Anaerolineae bacterium]|nr:UDP-N-acetylglucosamine 2-epimerase (non-hydrolyzing) [Anaerolineae bacterium]